jgi:hypothetical protein
MTRALSLIALTILGCGARTEESSVPGHRAGAFVAVGAKGTIVVGDGARFESVSSGITSDLYAVAAGPSRIIAVGAAGTVVVSSDARSWSSVDVGSKCDLHDVAVVADRFIAVGGDWSNGSCGFVSADGVTWSALGTPPTSEMARAIAVIDGAIVVSAYGRSDLMWPALFRIVDDRWEKLDIGDADRSVVFRGSATRGDTTFVAAGVVAEVRSVAPWTQRAVSPAIAAWDITANADKLVAVGENGIELQADGAWTSVLATKGIFWSGVAHGGDRFVAVGQKGRITSSTDGRSWIDATTSSSDDLRAVAYASAR